jgi:hypothetical protein
LSGIKGVAGAPALKSCATFVRAVIPEDSKETITMLIPFMLFAAFSPVGWGTGAIVGCLIGAFIGIALKLCGSGGRKY